MKLPLCDSCKWRVFRRWGLLIASAAGCELAAGVLDYALLAPNDASLRWFVAGVIAVLVGLTTVVTFKRRAAPFRQVDLDIDRGIFKLKPANSGYADLLNQEQAKLETVRCEMPATALS